MGFSTRYLLSILCILVIDDLRLSTVNCQEEEGSRCLSRKTFLALLRLPEVGSNLAAYSRTARIITDSKDRTEYANLKSLSSDDGDDTKICLPAGVYLALLLSSIGRAQSLLEDPIDRGYENADLTPEDIMESEKRSIATLAKNGDLPISIQDRQDEEEDDSKGRFDSLSSESLDGLMKILADGGVEDRRNIPEIAAEYTLPNGELDLEALARDYPPATKRNVAALARDFALPVSNGKRNIAALARDYGLPNGKRNVGMLARDRSLPNSGTILTSGGSGSGSNNHGKRNTETLDRIYLFPALHNGKRSVGSVAGMNYRLRYGKRYLGALARSGDIPVRDYDKRNMAALARNGDVFGAGKRNVGTLARDWSLPNQNRHGRSLTEKDLNAERLDQQRLTIDENTRNKPMQTSAFEAELANAKNDLLKNVIDGKRAKRQIDYSDEYPLPVMQNTNGFDYEDMIEALTGEYPNTEKRFMGAGGGKELQNVGDAATDIHIDMYQPSKRHIAALARLGWLRSFKPARFSRSPRDLVDREDSADGTATNDPSNPSTWALRSYRRPRTRCLQSLQVNCRQRLRRNLPLPSVDNILGHKIHFAAYNAV